MCQGLAHDCTVRVPHGVIYLAAQACGRVACKPHTRTWMMGSRSPTNVCRSVTTPETKKMVPITACQTLCQKHVTALQAWCGAEAA